MKNGSYTPFMKDSIPTVENIQNSFKIQAVSTRFYKKQISHHECHKNRYNENTNWPRQCSSEENFVCWILQQQPRTENTRLSRDTELILCTIFTSNILFNRKIHN